MDGVDWTNLGIGVFGFLCFVGLAAWVQKCAMADRASKREKIMAFHALPVSEELRLAREAYHAVLSANAHLPFPNLQALGDASRHMMKEERKRFAAYTGDVRDEADSSSTPEEVLNYRLTLNPAWKPACHIAEKKEIKA